jgi:Uma2 family endonuclease
MTVDELRKLPKIDGPFYYELRHGELVQVTRPKYKHYRIQNRLQELLRVAAPAGSFIGIEFAFRAVPEYDLRVADVAFISAERVACIDPEDNLHGAPDLVIEILSPSNTAAEIYEKEKLCLEHGCQEFWVVDLDLRQVKVSTPDGLTRTYRSGQDIPLPLFGAATLAVDAVFA